MKNQNGKKLGERIFAFFLKLRYVIYVISVILLLLAIKSAYGTFMEKAVAEKNAQRSLAQFEEIILKTDIYLVEKNPENLIESIVEIVNTEAVETEVTEIETLTPPFTPIAKLSIERLDLNVSVFSEWSYELLDISVNKFYGPEPNEPGNLIIIGHNYKNHVLFGGLDQIGRASCRVRV